MPETLREYARDAPEMRPENGPRLPRTAIPAQATEIRPRYARDTPRERPETAPYRLPAAARRDRAAPRRGGAGAGGGPRARTRRRRTPANDRAGGGVRLDKTQKAKGRIFSPQNTSHGNVKVHTPESVPSDTFSDTFSRAWMLGPKTQNTTIRRNSERGLPTSLTSI